MLSVSKLLRKELCVRGIDAQIQLAKPLEELRCGDVIDNFAEFGRMCSIMKSMLDLQKRLKGYDEALLILQRQGAL